MEIAGQICGDQNCRSRQLTRFLIRLLGGFLRLVYAILNRLERRDRHLLNENVGVQHHLHNAFDGTPL
jgi:hypothetical protein